jgi:hypothetical protein
VNIPDELIGHKIFKRMSDADAAKMVKQTAKFFDRVDAEGYNDYARGLWTEAVANHFSSLDGTGGRGEQYASDEIASISGSTLDRAAKLLVGNAPTKLDYNTKDLVEASVGMVPEIRARQIGWRDPVTGDKVGYATTNEAGERVSKKNGVAASSFSNWLWDSSAKAAAYKAELESQGVPWPRPKDRVPTEKEIDEVVKKHPKLWQAGLNDQNKEVKRDDAFAVYEINNRNPSAAVLEARAAKSRAVAKAWLSQNGLSTMTGEPVPLPRAKRERSEVKSTVDHIEPISTWNHLPPRERTMMADKASNYQIIEASLNGKKNDGGNDAVLSGAGTDDVYNKLAKNWGTNGSRVTLSSKEFGSRFSSDLDYQSADDLQRFASAYEQKRLSQIFNKPATEVVPIAKNRRTSIYDTFTPPDGTVAIKQNAPKPAQRQNNNSAARESGRKNLTQNRLKSMTADELQALIKNKGLNKGQFNKVVTALKERGVTVTKPVKHSTRTAAKKSETKASAKVAKTVVDAAKAREELLQRQREALRNQIQMDRDAGLSEGRIREKYRAQAARLKM